MAAEKDTSGFSESNLLPAPEMYFVGMEAHKISSFFYPVLFKMNASGLIAVIRKFEGMEGKQINLYLQSDNGTTEVVHNVEGDADQAVGITKEQALRHEGQLVTVAYTTVIEGRAQPSLPSEFTVGNNDLDVDKLPELENLDVRDDVLSIKAIEGQGGAFVHVPSIRGLHRGAYVSLDLYVSGSSSFAYGQVVRTVPNPGLKFFVPIGDIAMFIGSTVLIAYKIWLLDDVSYTNNGPAFTVTL
ncbi:hypothetical protein ACYZTL_24585 [Pseudomonas sp. LB3P81]